MITKQSFTTVAALIEAVKGARDDARREARRECGRGVLMSRGAWIKALGFDGNVLHGECDTWEFTGTVKQFKEIQALLASGTVEGIYIDGGFNWAESPRAYADGGYDAWVSEWSVSFGVNEKEVPAAAPVAPAAPSVEEIKASTLATFRTQLDEAQAFLANEEHILPGRNVVNSQRYIVICREVALRFSIVNGVAENPSIASAWDATRFSERDALAVAANTVNKAGDRGEAWEVVTAVKAEAGKLAAMIVMLEGVSA